MDKTRIPNKNSHPYALHCFDGGMQYGCSTGIDDRTTYGYGELDDYGFWQYPLYFDEEIKENPIKETYHISNIHLDGNEHGQLRKDVLYAELHDSRGNWIISATLDYILAAIRDRNYRVENVTIEYYVRNNIKCSRVKYNPARNGAINYD